MHIITAAHDLYPDPGSGGSGRYVYETGRRLAERGHRVSVVTRRRGDVPEREIVDGMVVYRFELEIADRPVSAVLAQLPRVVAAVGQHVSAATARSPPDVLSAHGPIASQLVAHHLDGELPRVTTFHSPWPTEYRIRVRGERFPPRRWLNEVARWWLERAELSNADQILTLSEFMKGELREEYGLDADVSVIPGGVDAGRFAPTAGGDGISIAGDPAFLTVRRLAERMGHGMLLEAFASIVDRYPGARLYLAGDGPLRSRLERTASSLGIDDRVTFLGFVPDRSLPAVYAAADVFVLPTAELEGFGLATLEALAAGTPVVATPVGGTVEVLSGLANALCVPAPVLLSRFDPRSLADGMAAWATLSPEAIRTAGRRGRRYAREQYSWKRTTSALEATFTDLVH